MISVIIPTCNDSRTIGYLLMYIKRVPFFESISEIIVSDGNSSDNTVEIAESFNVKVVKNEITGRAHQMNAGAKVATGAVLYFLHADSFPPRDFVHEIENHFHLGYSGGCFRLQFDHQHWFLRMNAWFTRFNLNWCRFGDQSLFVTRRVFNEIGGFREDHIVMEDQEIIRRIKSSSNFVVIPRYITSSARKYLETGIYRLQGIYFYIFALYSIGVPQPMLCKTYENLITSKAAV
jgi:rSAM/selenodomain-associated transferase 2